MNRSIQSDKAAPVLVVGAGPVGLVAAIRLRDQGFPVRIVDEQTEGGKRTYPVVLHARTLGLLAALGVTAPLEWRGRAVKQLAVYADNARRAVLTLPEASAVAPGALTLPQDVLRQALTLRLSELGVDIEWQTRLTALEQDQTGVRVGLVRRERVEGVSPALKTEWLDVAAESPSYQFVVGADGLRSAVRQALGIEMVQIGPRESYVFFDAEDQRAGDEAHLVLSGGYGSSVYPLQGNLSRFSFQVGVGTTHSPGLSQLEQLLMARMPWYVAAAATDFEWSGGADFHPALAASFGTDRVWLAGDAAHATGPLGGQSVNVGMHEANDLALRLAAQLQSPGRPLGAQYGEQRQIEWARLFGRGPSRPDVSKSPDWVRRHIASLLPSLPAAGDDLDDLLEQLRVRTA